MRAYKWEMDHFPILLECDKQEAFSIISHFGMDAKGATLEVKNGKVSFYGINLEKKMIAPIKYLSLIVGGHEVPTIGEEINLVLFLDDFQLVQLF